MNSRKFNQQEIAFGFDVSQNTVTTYREFIKTHSFLFFLLTPIWLTCFKYNIIQVDASNQ